MPVQIVSWTDAITDLYLGKIEAMVNYDDVVRSPSITIPMPAVVRTLRASHPSKKSVKFSRPNVATRDRYRCQYCLNKLAFSEITYDHVMPRSRGGRTTWENVVCACRSCNSKKDDKTPTEARMVLHCIPHRPNSLPLEPLRLTPPFPMQWAQFAIA